LKVGFEVESDFDLSVVRIDRCEPTNSMVFAWQFTADRSALSAASGLARP
jgi:hypothetical protein